jgi:hypothetical protein
VKPLSLPLRSWATTTSLCLNFLTNNARLLCKHFINFCCFRHECLFSISSPK